MEKRLNKKIEEYVTNFKDEIRKKITEINFEDKRKIAEMVEFVYDYNRLTLQRDDFIKRKRVKNSIPVLNRCIAKRANGEQCTRRRKVECEFCGTHSKGTPHGLITNTLSIEDTIQKLDVFAEDVNGIIYYIDKANNVYQAEDIIVNKVNPKIIAKYVKNGDHYSIPEFNI